MAKAIDRFAEHLARKGLSDRTVNLYAKMIKSIGRRFPRDPLQYLDQEITSTTRYSAYTVLRHWAEFSKDKELISRLDDPTLKRKLKGRGKKVSRITRPLTGDDLQAFLGAVDRTRGRKPEWVWPCITIMMRLGLRAQVDLCRLHREEVAQSVRTGRLHLETKGGRMRTVPTAQATEALSELLRVGRWETVAEAIVGEDDEKRAYREIHKALRKVARAAKIDVTEVHPHRLRHTAAHRLWERTKDILKVRDFLGHSHVSTTERYLRGDRTDEIGDDLKDMYE